MFFKNCEYKGTRRKQNAAIIPPFRDKQYILSIKYIQKIEMIGYKMVFNPFVFAEQLIVNFFACDKNHLEVF